MKMKIRGAVFPALLTALLALASTAAHADRLDDIKKAGVLRVAAFDSNPPFGFVDSTNNQIIGLDVDYARAVAKSLGVKLEVQPTNPANRIAFLKSGKVDLVFANFTITDGRKKEVDFSTPYFASGTQFIAKKGVLKSPDQLNGLRIGADKGTTNEQQVRSKYPNATIVAYDDTPFAFAALRTGNVQAITQDGPKLVALLARVPDKANYEIPAFTISNDYEGVGVPKGETRLLDAVNTTLTHLEADGQAAQIYDKWFGPKSAAPLPRLFKIGDPQKNS
ncbi:polar amino acid transport system substrate-binding protein [Paraburkholderia bannensis]|uniref:Polar amino acid transport system substrate-binding protein n=1 Tax=Paraburkholderia bannensis TaxID=765414 RepID=A0A7W9WUF0_9BURK|nr:polar amino acid transport system substrate-binding protein [Paraburkholderia sp. WP4_3_2]MBB6104307.1 polar amino acid transport system substrate-binding protein [Paraburkholderia bannensis]